MDLISIIVPVYNVADYLERCINSIFAQTYTELDIILVDDGSTDKSGYICDKYKDKDNRVRVIHKENGGLSSARNAGIDIMKGNCVFYLDSDDYIEPECIENLKNVLDKYNADISCCGFYMRFENGHSEKIGIDKSISLETYDAVQELMKLDYMMHMAWGKLYKSALFKTIRFPEGMLYEDLAVMYDLFLASDRIAYTGEPLYNYEIRTNSIMQSAFTEKQFVEVPIIERAMDMVDARYNDLLDITAGRRICSYCKVLHRILSSANKNEFKAMQDEVIAKIKKYAPIALKSKRIKRSIKIKTVTALLGRNIYQLVQNFSDMKQQKRAGQKYIV